MQNIRQKVLKNQLKPLLSLADILSRQSWKDTRKNCVEVLSDSSDKTAQDTGAFLKLLSNNLLFWLKYLRVLRGVPRVRQPPKFCHSFCNTAPVQGNLRPEFTINIQKAQKGKHHALIKTALFALTLPWRPRNFVRNDCLHIWPPPPLQASVIIMQA